MFFFHMFSLPPIGLYRHKLGKLTNDKHLYTGVLDEPVPTALTILRSLLNLGHRKEASTSGRQFFANPMNTFLL